jgi:hypothetical protein
MRRFVLRVFLGSIAVNAALAIYALLSQEFGEVEGKILFTSVCVSGASIVSLGCCAARDPRQRRLGAVPVLGIALSITGFALLIAAVWTDFQFMLLSKAAGSFIVFAAALAHASELSLCRLEPRFAWTRRFALALGAAVAAAIGVGIFAELANAWYWRSVGVATALCAAFTLAARVLHLRSWREPAGAISGGGRGVRFCPLCAEPLLAAAPGEDVACPRCHGVFRVSTAG